MSSRIDPKARLTLLEILEEHVYKRVRITLQNELGHIIRDNSFKHQNAHNVIGFKGHFYRYGPVIRSKEAPNLCHPDMRDRMKVYLERQAKLEREVATVRGFFQNLLIRSDRLADYLRILPDSLHGLVNKMAPYFYRDEGTFTDEEVLAFTEDNQTYIDLLITRMTYNLLQVTGV